MTVAIIPARAGSERVPGKNIKLLMGHPLIAYTISSAKTSGMFSKVICSTDSNEIARIAEYYGCDSVISRPREISGSKSPDILWIEHAILSGEIDTEYFAILRVTSPIKSQASLANSLKIAQTEKADSIRAIRKVRDHPGKVWTMDGQVSNRIRPLLNAPEGEIAFHARQYQDLPEYFVQTSSFEFIRTSSVSEHRSREGKNIYGYIIDYPETITLDYEDEFESLISLCERGRVLLPKVSIPNFKSGNES